MIRQHEVAYQELLLEELELEGTWGFLSELPIGDLDTFSCTTGIVGWIDRLNSYDYRVVVFFKSRKIFNSVEIRIDHANLRRELLFQARRKFVGIRIWKVRICVETITINTSRSYYKGILEAFLHS